MAAAPNTQKVDIGVACGGQAFPHNRFICAVDTIKRNHIRTFEINPLAIDHNMIRQGIFTTICMTVFKGTETNLMLYVVVYLIFYRQSNRKRMQRLLAVSIRPP